MPNVEKQIKVKHKHYSSIETLPIWNLHKIQETGDLRHLLILEDYTYLPENIDMYNLSIIYSQIVMQFEELDLKIQSLFADLCFSFFEYRAKRLKQQKVNNQFAKYLNLLDKIYFNYRYDNEIFDTAMEMYIYFKKTNKLDFDTLMHERILLFDYRTIQGEQRNKSDLLDEIISIREIVPNQPIDMKTTTVKEYMRIKKHARKVSENTRKQAEKQKSKVRTK